MMHAHHATTSQTARLLLLTGRTMLARRKLLPRTARHTMMPHKLSRPQPLRRSSYRR